MHLVRKLAVACLPQELFDATTEIALFAEGSFHRLYCISSPRTPVQYLMRVAIPVDPFFKTESEVATMHWLRRYASMPVPSVVAYSSSTSNEVGFEWILMEKVDGVAIDTVWDDMPFDEKTNLTVEFAEHMKQLCARRFPLLGNIYFADIWNQVGYKPLEFQPQHAALGTEAPEFGVDGEFVIGTMVSNRFSAQKRLVLRSNRGPFESSQELVTAETKVLGQCIHHLFPSPEDEYYYELDEDLAASGPEVFDVYNRFEQAIQQIFAGGDGPEDAKILWHDDLAERNVLVDPKSHKLVSVVDWESASIVPAWETKGAMPYFLKGIEVREPAPFGSLSDEDEANTTLIRKDWDLVLLRRKYMEIIGSLYDTTPDIQTRVGHKQHVSKLLGSFEDIWEHTRHWLNEKYKP